MAVSICLEVDPSQYYKELAASPSAQSIEHSHQTSVTITVGVLSLMSDRDTYPYQVYSQCAL